MCVPFPLPVKCNCAFPVLEDNKIACGPTYCPAGTECLLDGSCCEGKANALKTECCKNGVDKVVGICCEELSDPDCETEVDETTGCKKCKSTVPVYCANLQSKWRASLEDSIWLEDGIAAGCTDQYRHVFELAPGGEKACPMSNNWSDAYDGDVFYCRQDIWDKNENYWIEGNGEICNTGKKMLCCKDGICVEM